MNKPLNIDEYITGFPANVQQLLEQLRAIIKAAAPQATEVISYAMPAFKQHTVLVYFAGYANHIGFYPTSSGIEAFKEEFTARNYKWSKGAVQFPLNQPLPAELITRIVKFRLNQDMEKAKAKKK
ncbi:Uncharacterized conserved protein YdhG, YjbR/CyaY-like superfamily, DUF1801 family [Mucilaginibacter pineti]|uniref:Uncharacterized conserved protein YdhG, YjbR/CyaY-like superfamily, DUF1801 family n=1 Tax=Mucilaginibacter pineti TaxID=1391627 RepID=A0A1G7B179_9SPHI|nr:DUF1801 domain-containing protein [Mucilaginibacter pineti]SDE20878.1 Uncharacterized conserved protein YdhG, YjbR/CyaY-like superfamily, DUF1801 family [Mucilaginibacter pineti]